MTRITVLAAALVFALVPSAVVGQPERKSGSTRPSNPAPPETGVGERGTQVGPTSPAESSSQSRPATGQRIEPGDQEKQK